MAAKKPATKKAKKKLSADERKQRKAKQDHIRSARTLFRNIGFERVSEIAEMQIEFGGQKGEFDDAFLCENLFVLVEYTISQASDVSGHLKHKKIIFSKVLADAKGFLAYLRKKSSLFDQRLADNFHEDKYIIKIIYCSRNEVDNSSKLVVAEPVYLDYPILKYFEKLANVIKLSAQNEFLNFLEIDPYLVAKGGIFSTPSTVDYEGSILPESSSGFLPGYKVVSFYTEAAALLNRAYVLRRDGWRSSFQAYQRMVDGKKIEAIRKSLKLEKRVFVNNVIATLPSDVHPKSDSGKTVDIASLVKAEPVKIALPLRANSVGIIDGQHRLYAYYEEKVDDPKIAKLRNQQNILVTGIVYPEGTSSDEAERFAATLFLAINSNQTNAPTPLRQEIEVLLRPFSQIAIGRQIMQRLSTNGPLAGHVEKFFFEKGKLKTSSIVSFGLGPLIKLGGKDSLFKIFVHPEKDKIETGSSPVGLEAYLNFSVSAINTFLGAVKTNVDANRWTSNPTVKDRLLSVTYVNSFLITLRHLIEKDNEINFDGLKAALNGIGEFDFKSYHSSQYNRMAAKIFEEHFGKSPN
jgi:DGQHR domain-containing protein